MEIVIRKGPHAHRGRGGGVFRAAAGGDVPGLYVQNCPVVPKMEYSACAMQTGWNIKFKKSGRNVCTVYPMDGYFICMILTGGDSMMELEARLEEFTPYMREKFMDTKVFRGSRWLFLEIRDGGTERDLEELVLLKLRSMGIAPGPVTVGEKNGRGKGKRTRDEN